MTITRDEIFEVVKTCLKEALDEKSKEMPADLGNDTELFGRGALLDSLGLVTMVMDIENRLEDEHQTTVVLASDRAMSRRQSPFRTVGALVEYIEAQLTGTAE